MERGVTKDVTIVLSQLRSIPVIETFWEEYPFYYEATGKLDFVDSYGNLRTIHKGDFIVWDKSGAFKPRRKYSWNKMYGEYLKESLKENSNGSYETRRVE